MLDRYHQMAEEERLRDLRRQAASSRLAHQAVAAQDRSLHAAYARLISWITDSEEEAPARHEATASLRTVRQS
jgi:hypothetical protein